MTDQEGIKFDELKPRFDLLPPDALLSVAEVLRFGAEKYEDRNWENGFCWGRLIGSCGRHLLQFMRGEDYDEESGLPHLSHLACTSLMLLAFFLREEGIDDRSLFLPSVQRRKPTHRSEIL